MPAINRIGSGVSSKASRTRQLVDPPPGGKRRVRQRVYGVIMRSLANGMWEVQWGGGEIEALSPSKVRHEGEPTDETMSIVQVYNMQR